MDRANKRPAPSKDRSAWVVVLYVIAAPLYAIRGAAILLRLLRFRLLSRHGYVGCPHCGTTNALDVLATCPKCQTTEYGNRLRCSGCGTRTTAFVCDSCGVTIQVF